jgi:hypothetical protein
MVCLRSIRVDTLHKGDTDDDHNNKPLVLIFIWNLDLKNMLRLHLREAN